MPNTKRKGAGAKLPLILLSTLLLLLLFVAPVSAFTPGDVTENGLINVQDVVLVMQHILGIADPELTESQQLAADVNGDGVINVQDATLIMQYVLGLIDEFPVEPLVIESVMAVNRTTIVLELAEGLSAAVVENTDNYEVTVDDEAVEVEEADYDADEDEATLTVDLEGLSGVLVVNGVEAEDEVPAIPEFTSVSAEEANRDITMHFNVPVYALADLVPDVDIEVTVDGDDVGANFEIHIEESADDAEDTVVLRVSAAFRPGANDSVVVTLTTSGIDKIVNVWDEPVEAPQIRATTAVPDDENPTFTSITVYNNAMFVLANFSEPVHTDGNVISVGPGLTQVSVTGTMPDDTPLVFSGDGVNPGLVLDEEQQSLRIELNEAVPAGANITVSFGVTAGGWIQDRAGNTLAGTFTRTGTAIAGPNLKNAKASDLSVNAANQTQVFEVTLVGDLAEGEEITVDLSDAVAEGVTYSLNDARYTAAGASGTVTTDGTTLTFTAGEDIDDDTTIVITASEAATTGLGVEADVEVVFTRQDIGATATALFDIIPGLSNLSADTSYQMTDPRDGLDYDAPVAVLASGVADHEVEFGFRLQGELASGDRVLIDVSNLVNAGVTFDSGELDVDHADAAVSMVGNVIRVTATADIPNLTDIVATAGNVDVSTGSAAADLAVTFSRNDSGFSAYAEVDIVPSFSEVAVTDVTDEDNQIVFISFRLDGARTAAGFFASVNLDHDNKGFIFTDAEVVLVSHGSATIGAGGVVNYFAPFGGLAHGTEVTIQVSGIDVPVNTDDAIALFTRSGGFQAVDVIEVQ